jgi:hypothetical protein
MAGDANASAYELELVDKPDSEAGLGRVRIHRGENLIRRDGRTIVCDGAGGARATLSLAGALPRNVAKGLGTISSGGQAILWVLDDGVTVLMRRHPVRSQGGKEGGCRL